MVKNFTRTSNFKGDLSVGMWVECGLYNLGIGVLVAMKESERQPRLSEFTHSNVQVIFMDGQQMNVDCLFIRSGVQCGLLLDNELADSATIDQLKIKSDIYIADKAKQEEAERLAHALAVERVSSATEYQHLTKLGEYPNAADVAKNIRADLKHHFPKHVRFSVKTRHGTSVDISWTDGATKDEVDAVVQKHQFGHFDGMQDIYNNNNDAFNEVFGGVRFVFTNRDISDDQIKTAISELCNTKEINGKPAIEHPEMSTESYRKGGLYNVYFDSCDWESCQHLISQKAYAKSYYVKPEPAAKPARKQTTVKRSTSEPVSGEKVEFHDMEKRNYSKRGEEVTVFVLSPVIRVSRDSFMALLELAKTLKGYYSKYTGGGVKAGFIFQDKESAEQFLKLAA